MKIIHTIILFLFIIFCNAQTNNLDEIRRTYLESPQSVKNINKLISMCEGHKKDSTIYAYRAAANIMLIKYKYNPLNKLELFTDYSKKLDLIVINNLNNIEIRLLRYCLQKQSPRFLGYNNNLELDYQFILGNIDDQSKDLQDFVNLTLKAL